MVLDRLVIKKEFGDLKKGGTKGAQRICTYYAYFYVHYPVNGLEYVRWAYLNMSVGLRICPLDSGFVRWAPFMLLFFLGDPEKKFLLFYHYPTAKLSLPNSLRTNYQYHYWITGVYSAVCGGDNLRPEHA